MRGKGLLKDVSCWGKTLLLPLGCGMLALNGGCAKKLAEKAIGTIKRPRSQCQCTNVQIVVLLARYCSLESLQ